MNLFKRGFASVTRKAGKSAILLVLIFILCNIIAGAISVQNAINKTREVMQDEIGMEVSISLDTASIMKSNSSMGDISNIDSLTPEVIKEIGTSEYVKSYDYYTSMSLTSKTLSLVESESDSSTSEASIPNDPANSTGGSKSQGNASSGGGLMGVSSSGGFKLSGGENANVTAIEDGDVTLSSGSTFTQDQMDNGENVVLISTDLAEANNLSVGSTITMNRSLYKMSASSGTSGRMKIDRTATPAATLSFDFTVVGIFEPQSELSTSEDGTLEQVQSSLVNTMYTSNTTINLLNEQVSAEEKTINGENVTSTFNQYTPTFVLNDPEDLGVFTSTQKSKLPTNYIFTDNSDTYNDATAPMENLNWISGIILYVAIGATVLILSLLITLFLRDRRHEMGIYLSLGERKFKIASQILFEVMCIAIISISLSIFSGNMLASGISSSMLENQIVAEQQQASADAKVASKSFGPGTKTTQDSTSKLLATTEEMKDSYSVSLDFSVIILIFVVGVGTVFISTLIPIVYTLRLKPKKILM